MRSSLNPKCDRALLLETPYNHNNGMSISDSCKGAKSPTLVLMLSPPQLHITTKPNCTDHRKSASSSAGSIAAARREQVPILQEQRKMRISHYGRKSQSPSITHSTTLHHPHSSSNIQQQKRCSFITPNSDPAVVAYHDQEWGVPDHDDKLLFELLVLTGAQVGSDWASVLRRRQDYRDAFSGFDADIVSKFSEKKMCCISSEYSIELSLVRGVVDNSKKILELKKELGSLDKYLWGFVNEKPMITRYKWCHKIPAKTSKSETASKDMVRRGFRFVGPTVVYSFMQAAGLTNDHLTTCPRHSQCQLPPS